MSTETIFVHEYLTLTWAVHVVSSDELPDLPELPEHDCLGFCKRRKDKTIKYYTLPTCLHIICDAELQYRILQKDYSCPTCQRAWKNNECFDWGINYVK